ncbi:MAG: PAS domain-containing protein [Muribaculaceae bacterium]|nr:PAS domain-containing protein [Muribaculaceae bacterium]
MNTRLVFLILLIAFAGTLLSSLLFKEYGIWLPLIFGIIGLLFLFLLYMRIVTSNHTVQIGMELLAAQDFNSRLRKVGERNADRVVRLFNTMIDHLREERLKNIEQESLLKLLLDASPMGVAIMDYDGHFSTCNRAFLKITSTGDITALKGKLPEEWPIELAAALTSLKVGKSKVVSLGNSMRYRCYHLNFMRRGFPVDFYLIESLTEEMRDAERSAYEKVIRILSHEVNNTMCGVSSVLNLISDSIAESDLKEAVESCDARCEQLCEFVTSYADVIRLPKPDLKEVDLCNEIHSMLPFLNMLIREDIELFTEIPENPLWIKGDSIQLQQVIINIFKNAVESISGKGYVLIRAYNDKDGTALEIVNNGDPISEEVASNMFRPFYTNKPNGRGIGLTLTSEILTRHKANFRLFTDKDGLTRFKINFHP